MKPQEVYAVVVLESRDEIMIKLLPERRKWYFPGGDVPEGENPKEHIQSIVFQEIDGIKILETVSIGTLTHDAKPMEIFFIRCEGWPDRHTDFYSARFTHDISPYPLSSLGFKILALYKKYLRRQIRRTNKEIIYGLPL